MIASVSGISLAGTSRYSRLNGIVMPISKLMQCWKCEWLRGWLGIGVSSPFATWESVWYFVFGDLVNASSQSYLLRRY
eukprot:scaffold43737_cov44-Attheya_sp.AAC.3